VSTIERRIARDPSDAGAHGSAGRELAGLGRLTEAAASYERALALGFESPVITDLMAIVYFTLGDDGRALALLRQYVPAADAQRVWNRTFARPHPERMRTPCVELVWHAQASTAPDLALLSGPSASFVGNLGSANVWNPFQSDR
jgi:predicted Zn-dependent protease